MIKISDKAKLAVMPIITAKNKEDEKQAEIMRDIYKYHWLNGGYEEFILDAFNWTGSKGTC